MSNEASGEDQPRRRRRTPERGGKPAERRRRTVKATPVQMKGSDMAVMNA